MIYFVDWNVLRDALKNCSLKLFLILFAAAAVKTALGSASPVVVEGVPDPARRPERYVPDITKITSRLGVRIKFPLDEAIRRSAAAL